ncbi:MAG: TIGR00282 family metallophosphoesterase [Kiritimatiellia bacterium]
MKILVAGDIVGSPGRTAFARIITRMKKNGEINFAVANAENAAGGKGLTPATAEELLAAGADVLTLGDHAWDQKEIVAYLDREPRVIRPANFAPGCPGRGWTTLQTAFGPVTVINLVGRVFLSPYDCPFRAADRILKELDTGSRIILVDIHAEATSEKIVLGRYLDGRVSCVFGTHTHVQTSDETILPKGTAYITDLGMTGPKDSAIGRELRSTMEMFLTGMPIRFKVAQNDVALEGIIVEIDPQTGRARSVKRMREFVD